jgi:quercetin dioxygenase-like cupin family protein
MRKILFVTAAAMLVASPAQAKGMKWMDASGAGLPAGAKMAVVSGDPSKAGKFIIRAKFPANYTVPPHSHPGDEAVRVLNGASLAYGMGDKVDTANSGSLTKGYHVTMKAGMNHWVTTSAPTDIQVSGDGPFAITYANPADDPRTAKK